MNLWEKIKNRWPIMLKKTYLERLATIAEEQADMIKLHKNNLDGMAAVLRRCYPVVKDNVKVQIIPPDYEGDPIPTWGIQIKFEAQQFNRASLEWLTARIGGMVIEQLQKIKAQDQKENAPKIILPGKGLPPGKRI